MARLLFLVLLAALLLGAACYVASRIAGRPAVADTTGKVLVALVIAAVAFWLFGGGALIGGWH